MSEPGEDLARSSESGDEGREEEELGESEDWQKLESCLSKQMENWNNCFGLRL